MFTIAVDRSANAVIIPKVSESTRLLHNSYVDIFIEHLFLLYQQGQKKQYLPWGWFPFLIPIKKFLYLAKYLVELLFSTNINIGILNIGLHAEHVGITSDRKYCL